MAFNKMAMHVAVLLTVLSTSCICVSLALTAAQPLCKEMSRQEVITAELSWVEMMQASHWSMPVKYN